VDEIRELNEELDETIKKLEKIKRLKG